MSARAQAGAGGGASLAREAASVACHATSLADCAAAHAPRITPVLRRFAAPVCLAALCLAAALATSGCGSVGAASGAAAAAATGIATANPAVGIGVGIAVQATTDEAVNRFMKGMHADQQQLIATTAGRLPVGGSDVWRIKHRLPIENGHGQVTVVRAFASPLALCKEFVFSVQDGNAANAPEQWFTATACQDTGGWQWASAEPAVDRWGTLQ